jgi:hypothetical protein
LWNIGAGLAVVALGVVCLGIYCFRARSSQVQGWKRRALVAALLIAANFPVAGALVVSAEYLSRQYVVVVENRSPWPLKDLTFRSPLARHTFGTVPAGSTRKCIFHFAGEGAVTYVASLNGVEEKGILDGYITWSGGRARLQVSEAGVIGIENVRF